jgi:hypothetical protein
MGYYDKITMILALNLHKNINFKLVATCVGEYNYGIIVNTGEAITACTQLIILHN